MRIIFSKDRAAQLDLLLRSLERYAEPERTIVIWQASPGDFSHGYMICRNEHREVEWWRENAAQDFETLVRIALDTTDEHTTFLCDDDVIYLPFKPWAKWPEGLLCWSLRLGANTTRSYTRGVEQPYPGAFWAWGEWDVTGSDFDYPGSIDGHTFRTADLRVMLSGRPIPNPTALECALVEGCDDLQLARPAMACYVHSVLVGVPINRVSEQSNVPYSGGIEYAADHLNDRFLDGHRLDLDAIDSEAVTGAHTALELAWQTQVEVL